MNVIRMNPQPLRLAAMTLALACAGCSSLGGMIQPDKIDYKSASKPSGEPVRKLEVPPDLTKPGSDGRYAIPGSATATLSGYQQQTEQVVAQKTSTAVLPAVAGMRLERSGSERWLVLDKEPAELWAQLRDFWQTNGFILVVDSPQTGIMETDWAENRAKIPDDLIRRTIGKVIDGLYSTGERDKFRLRVERNPNGSLDVFISQRGFEEVLVGADKTQSRWVKRPNDPGLEAELLARLMQYLGAPPEQAAQQKAAIAKPAPAAASRVTTSGAAPQLTLADPFDRSWRAVGLALDRSNFTVEDRDRSKGLYFVRYVDPKDGETTPGFFGKLFGKKADANKNAKRYQVSVQAAGGGTVVTVQGADGKPAVADTAASMLKLIDAEVR